MGLPREDVLLLLRALKRGIADPKSVRKALDRRAAKPVSLLEALHVPDPQALAKDAWTPDAAADRELLDSLRDLLVGSGELKAFEWDKIFASIVRPSARAGFAPLAVPMEFDGYTLQWEVARRERGVVYRAKDPAGRDVAIKVFRRDAPVQGDFPRVEGLAYAVAPFEEGESLEARGKHGLKWAATAVANAAERLRATPHGALTPGRIVVRKDDRVAVLGLEHAKALPPSSRAAAYGPGDDVRALGAILYEAITGHAPSGSVSPAEREKDVDPSLDRVVASALSGGYASTGELADDLGRWLKGQPVTARAVSKAAAKAVAGGSRAWIWAAAAGLAVAALSTWLATRPRVEPPAAAPAPVLAKAELPRAPVPPKPLEAPKPAPLKPREIPQRPLTADEDLALNNECLRADGSGDDARIVAAANEAVQRGTKKDWPYAYLVRAYTRRDELDMALEYAVRATTQWPDKREFLQLRMETLVYRGQASRALADLQLLYGGKTAELYKETLALIDQVKADPMDGRTRMLLGVHHYVRHHFDTASREFTAALEVGQRRALAWRAHSAAGMDHKAQAVADAQVYLKEFPADFASDELRSLLAALGN